MPFLSLQDFLVKAPAFSFPSPALLQLSCLSSYCCSAASLLSSSCITFFCWTFFPFLSIFISLGHSLRITFLVVQRFHSSSLSFLNTPALMSMVCIIAFTFLSSSVSPVSLPLRTYAGKSHKIGKHY